MSNDTTPVKKKKSPKRKPSAIPDTIPVDLAAIPVPPIIQQRYNNSGHHVTERMKQFVEEYMIDLNPNKAAARVGYEDQSVYGIRALMDHPWVKYEIHKRIQERAQRANIHADYVLTTIYETVERCRQAFPVLDKKGNPVMIESPTGEIVPAYAFQPAEVLKGCQLLGAHLGMWDDKNKGRSNDQPKVAFEGSIEDLREVIKGVIINV